MKTMIKYNLVYLQLKSSVFSCKMKPNREINLQPKSNRPSSFIALFIMFLVRLGSELHSLIICLLMKNGGIPLRAIPKGTTSKLVGFFSDYPFICERLAEKLQIPLLLRNNAPIDLLN